MKCFVVQSQHHATLLQRVLGSEWMVIPMLFTLVGIAFEEIVISYAIYDQESEGLSDWINQQLLTRFSNKLKTPIHV